MITHIILAPDKEDILVFLTGQEEIEAMARDIRLIANDSSTSGSSTNLLFENNNTTYQPNKKLVVLPLYASQQLTIMNKIMNGRIGLSFKIMQILRRFNFFFFFFSRIPIP